MTTQTSPALADQAPSCSRDNALQNEINVAVSNQYELLQNEDVDDEMPMLTPNPVVTIQPPKVKKVRVPPITISNQTTKQVRELMVQINVAQTDYMMRAIKTGVQLLCSTEEGFRNIVNALKQSNVQFYTYTLVTEQPVKVILSGLSVYDTAELETELLAHGVIPAELKLFSRKVVDLEESALYLLHFVKGAVKLSELQKIKALFNTVVKWRYYDRKPTDAVQCHRCQRFGHGMRNCNLIPLCVKCGEKHLSAECKLPKKADLQHVDRNTTRASIKCANCSGQHTANYRGCPSRKIYIEKLEKMRADRRQQAPPLPARPNRVNNPPHSATAGSYAQALMGNTSSNNSLFSMSEFLALAREMFDRLASCQTKQQQILALFELTTKYVYNV